MERNDYIKCRSKFIPTSIKLVIVAESPPASCKYFYKPEGAVTEPLFSALMEQLGIHPATKQVGLREFQRRGWVLVDATYNPVNRLKSKERDAVIKRDYMPLHDDLTRMLPDRSVPVILLKANVCRLLEPLLMGDGFNILNRGRVVYFPSTGRQKDFHRQFGGILQSAIMSAGET